jgi:uncharacterized membrane protein YgcG
MKKALFLLLPAISVISYAQQPAHVQDKEQLFTRDEVFRLDSLLKQYHDQSGKIVLIATDSADVNKPDYNNELFLQYVPDSTSKAIVLMLLMSRKSQSIKIIITKPLVPYVSPQRILEMIEAGIPAIKEKQREEGAMLICRKAMEFLDGLPKN